jgi:hypothetical protein
VLGDENGVILGSHSLFPNRIVDGVVNGSLACLVPWNANRVLDRSLFGFVDRLANGVLNRFGMVFVDRFTDGVIDGSLFGFVDRFANGVLNVLCVIFVNRFSNRVINHTLFCLVDRFHHGVFGGPCFGFILGHHHGVLDVLGDGFGYHPRSLNFLIFIIEFATVAVAYFFHAIVNDLTYRFHASVCSASDGNRLVRFDNRLNDRRVAIAASLVTNRTTIGGECCV